MAGWGGCRRPSVASVGWAERSGAEESAPPDQGESGMSRPELMNPALQERIEVLHATAVTRHDSPPGLRKEHVREVGSPCIGDFGTPHTNELRYGDPLAGVSNAWSRRSNHGLDVRSRHGADTAWGALTRTERS